MRKAALLLIGGALIALAVYLFPLYYGQELFVGWLQTQTGGDYERAVVWAALIAIGIAGAGFLMMRPQYLKQLADPMKFLIAIGVIVVAYILLVGAV